MAGVASTPKLLPPSRMTSPSFTTTSCGIIDQRRGVDSDARADSIASSQPACVITNFALLKSGLGGS
jgi:hypothetical protein